jgi:hypothetical protein
MLDNRLRNLTEVPSRRSVQHSSVNATIGVYILADTILGKKAIHQITGICIAQHSTKQPPVDQSAQE